MTSYCLYCVSGSERTAEVNTFRGEQVQSIMHPPNQTGREGRTSRRFCAPPTQSVFEFLVPLLAKSTGRYNVVGCKLSPSSILGISQLFLIGLGLDDCHFALISVIRQLELAAWEYCHCVGTTSNTIFQRHYYM